MLDDAFNISSVVLAPRLPFQRFDDCFIVDRGASDVIDPRVRMRIHDFVVQKPVKRGGALQPAVADIAFENHWKIF